MNRQTGTVHLLYSPGIVPVIRDIFDGWKETGSIRIMPDSTAAGTDGKGTDALLQYGRHPMHEIFLLKRERHLWINVDSDGAVKDNNPCL